MRLQQRACHAGCAESQHLQRPLFAHSAQRVAPGRIVSSAFGSPAVLQDRQQQQRQQQANPRPAAVGQRQVRHCVLMVHSGRKSFKLHAEFIVHVSTYMCHSGFK